MAQVRVGRVRRGRPGLVWAVGAMAMGMVGVAAQGQPDPFGPRPRDPFGPTPPARGVNPAAPAAPGTPPAARAPEADDGEPVAPLRSGVRAERLRVMQSVIPEVVIVPDAGSYVRALEAWTPLRRFPVLIDDGTRAGREDIARFVRAFGPRRVVRWRAPDGPGLASAEDVRARAESALAGVWGVGGEGAASLGEAVRGVCGAEAPGVVVAHGSDPAWAGALALAIGRGQPIVWVEARQDVSGELSKAEGDALCAAVETALTESGLAWSEMGDTVDTLALCLNTPSRMGTGAEGQRVAVTDRLGHFTDEQTDVRRWGWASQVHGSAAQSAYRAMCGLFLGLDGAWLFDTYPAGQPWDSYALRFAAQVLGQEPAIEAVLTERPSNGLGRWRMATALGLSAPLVMVNTHGMRNFFELTDGTGWCGDVPLLDEPAAVYFIHSWSAHAPGDRGTLAGRWLERGAFAYAGAVQEPYLQSFVPPMAIAGRLRAGACWAVTCRSDGAPAWRIALFGDPLLVMGPAQERAEEGLPLEGAVGLEESMREALRGGRLGEAIGELVLMGRDEQVARLVGATLRSEERALGSEAAGAALPSVLRAAGREASRLDDFYALYRRLDDAAASDPVNRDLLWMAARRGGPSDGGIVSLLRPHVRPEQRTPDTVELAMHAAAAGQRSAAVVMLTDYRRTLTDVAEQRQVDRAMELIRGR